MHFRYIYRTLLIIILALLPLLSHLSFAQSNHAQVAGRVRKINQQLRDNLDQRPLPKKVLEALIERKNLLKRLFAEDPATASQLIMAYPRNLQAELQLSKFLERRSLRRGKLQIQIEDDFQARSSKTIHRLRTSDNEIITLHFSKPQPSVRPDSAIQVRGAELDNDFLVEQTGVIMESPSPLQIPNVDSSSVGGALTPSTSERAVAIILFNFTNDTTQPYTKEQAYANIFTTPRSANAYWTEASAGKISFSGSLSDVYGWYTISPTAACDSDAWAVAATNAARANGFDISKYQHVMFMFPYNNRCSWGGLANLSGIYSWHNVNPAWGAEYARLTEAHELGHNLGLSHANGLQCTNSSGALVPISDRCINREYADDFDVMGHVYVLPNGFHLTQLGLIGAGQAREVTGPGTYSIAPLSPTSSSMQLLKIFRERDLFGPNRYFYIEYRQPSANFMYGGDHPLYRGVTLRLADAIENGGSNAQLLVMSNRYALHDLNAPLTSDDIFEDVAKGIRVRTLGTTPSAATVGVEYFCPPIRYWNIGVGSTEGFPAEKPGVFRSFNLAIDGREHCGAGTVSISVNLPSGWATSPTTIPNLALPAAGGASTTFQIKSAVDTADGTYPIQFIVTDLSRPGESTTLTYQYGVSRGCIPRNPSFQVTPTSQQSRAGGTLQYLVELTNNDSSDCPPQSYLADIFWPLPFGWSQIPEEPGFYSGIPEFNALLPGSKQVYNFAITSAASAADGSYPLAFDVLGDSGFTSAHIPITYVVNNLAASAAPSNLAAQILVATGVQPLYSVRLTWKDNSINELRFGVWASAPGSTTWTKLAQVAANVVTWTHYSPSPGKWSYRISAENSAIGSPTYSSNVAVSIPGPSSTPSPSANSSPAYAN